VQLNVILVSFGNGGEQKSIQKFGLEVKVLELLQKKPGLNGSF